MFSLFYAYHTDKKTAVIMTITAVSTSYRKYLGLILTIVRCFFGDLDIMDVRFFHTC